MQQKSPIFPKWRLLLEYFSAIQQAQLNWYEQLQCYLYTGRWVQLWWKGGLLFELIMAMVYILGIIQLSDEESSKNELNVIQTD